MTTEGLDDTQGSTRSGEVDETADASGADEANPNPATADDTPAVAERGSSTYATGGGGVSLAHRIASIYLASILTSVRRTEASELPVRRVSFQTGPVHLVDDLLIECSDGTTNVTLAVACRATPNFVRSDKETVKLVGSLLAEVAKFDTDTHHVAVAVAGWSSQWKNLATVCDIARSHADAASFRASLDVDKRWLQQVRDRLDQFEQMVNLATNQAKSEIEVRQLAFRLLSRLHVVGFAVQSPDERDRTATATTLDSLGVEAVDGIAIRNRLEVEATRYDATGAVVDLNILRRDLHALLKAEATRTIKAWEALAEHRRVAAASVRATIGVDTTTSTSLAITFAGRRDDLSTGIRKAGTEATALIVCGESGTGKSALTLSAIAQLEADDPAGFEALVVNFRALPQTSMEFRTVVGASMAEVLAELSAPTRVLVIDAADAALERSAMLLTDLVQAAVKAGVGIIAVTADTAREFVEEQISVGFGKGAASFTVQPLSNTEIQAVADHFPLLRSILCDLPTASLLRRLVVLDLLARTGIELRSSMSEWECLELIWRRIVRGEGNPAAGSAEAREQTLLSVAAATLNVPTDRQPGVALDPTAVDALRRDHLLTPASPFFGRPEFAHDELRRYATAILLVRAQNMTATLQSAGSPRWALSAATLACKGQLLAPGASAPQVFARAIQEFSVFASQYGPRWSDLPVEAVLDTPNAYECLKAELENLSSPLRTDDVVRIVGQRHSSNGLPDPIVSVPVVRVLLDRPEPWRVSKPSFELLAGWMQSLALLNIPAGNRLRIALRDRLLAYWNSFPPLELGESDTKHDSFAELGSRPRYERQRELPYQVTNAEYVECLALLGPDIDDRVEECLLAIADDAPAFLAPAADSPISARAIALRDPELLARLIEAYYIDDDDTDWGLEEGVRDHQGRWKGFSTTFFEYYYGGFWALFNLGSHKTSVRVLNTILNHGARIRVRTLAGLGNDALEVPPSQQPESESADNRETGARLNLDGYPRLYVGDTHVWSWYRGTSVGPYSGMSALLAMERVAEGWLDAGVSPAQLAKALLEGCKNLAVPGMLFGLLARHIDKVTDELDPFLAEPRVWQLEFARATGEYSGLRARTDDLKHQERRKWSPHEVCAALITTGDEDRAPALRAVGDLLLANGNRLGVPQELTKTWAASLDADRYRVTQQGAQLYLQVDPPEELIVAQAQHAVFQEQFNTSTRLANRYWGSAKYDADYVAPTSAEVAEDLAAGRKLLEADNEIMPTRPLDAVAHVVRVAVQRAAVGDFSALGVEAPFAAKFVLELALAFKAKHDQRGEGQYFDIGADRAVAHALPLFLLPVLADLLPPIGAAAADVGEAGMAIAGRAPLETRLHLARGCDILWVTPCHGNPCIHRTAINWLVETARGAEIGEWDMAAQRRPRVYIDGDVTARLQKLDGASVDLSMLDAPIRGLGAAATTKHCSTVEAARLLSQFLYVQRRTMVFQKGRFSSTDFRGTHALAAARALLDNYATNQDPQPVLEHLDALSADASLLFGSLGGFAAAGAENDRRAQAAQQLWPTVFSHALTYANHDPSPYDDNHWGDWAAAALLPDPPSWSHGLHNELAGQPIDWVHGEDLLDFVDQWVPIGRGKTKCVDALIRVVRKLPPAVQVIQGLNWITEVCVRDGQVVVNQTRFSNEWLKEVRGAAEELEVLGEWQKFVDAMVVAGNQGLAPYSR